MSKFRKKGRSKYNAFLYFPVFFCIVFIFTTFKTALGDNSFQILETAVKKGVSVGELSNEELQYLLLSIPENDNIPRLTNVLKGSRPDKYRMRAFHTLALIRPKSFDSIIEFAMKDPALPKGELLAKLARVDRRGFKEQVLKHAKTLLGQNPYHPQAPNICRALSMLKDRKADEALKKYFEALNSDNSFTQDVKKADVVIRALLESRNRMRSEKVCGELMEKLGNIKNIKSLFDVGVMLCAYGKERDGREVLESLNRAINRKRFDKYTFYKKVYKKYDKNLGLCMMRISLENEDITVEVKKDFMEILAAEKYPGVREFMINLMDEEGPGFERAALILAVYYRDRRVRKHVMLQFPEEGYWTEAKKAQRRDLAKAYLVLSEKRDELFYKQLTEDDSLIKKAYGCEGLKYINARGKKREMKSLFRNMKWSNQRQNAVSFQAARALFRFGVRHYLVNMLKTAKIPWKVKAEGFAAMGETGDEDDLEIYKHIFDELPPQLYDAYLDSLARIARQKTVPLMARQKGRQEEPLRDCRLLMKKALNHRDVNFRRKAAGRIEEYVYHWQSVPLLKDCIQSEDSVQKYSGIIAFRNVTDHTTARKARKAMYRCFTDPDFKVKTATAAVHTLLELRIRGYIDREF